MTTGTHCGLRNVDLAALLALIFWACFFRASGVAAADPNASQDVPVQSEEPAQTDAPAPSEPPAQTGDVFLQMDGAGINGNDWLKCHAILRNDGTFTITVDYNAENSGIETDSGTWAENEDRLSVPHRDAGFQRHLGRRRVYHGGHKR